LIRQVVNIYSTFVAFGDVAKCLAATSTEAAPWYVAPADDKENARLIVSQIIVDTLESLKLSFPKTTEKRRLQLLEICKRLAE
jgi:hypothetical protein